MKCTSQILITMRLYMQQAPVGRNETNGYGTPSSLAVLTPHLRQLATTTTEPEGRLWVATSPWRAFENCNQFLTIKYSDWLKGFEASRVLTEMRWWSITHFPLSQPVSCDLLFLKLGRALRVGSGVSLANGSARRCHGIFLWSFRPLPRRKGFFPAVL